MSGVALTTISPSSTSSRRSTPCVDGCCGPIEIVIWVSSGRSTISNCGGMFTVVLMKNRTYETYRTYRSSRSYHLLLQRIWFIPAQRKILPQGVALPVLWQQYSSQVRMIVKNDTEEIKRFALMPV